MMAAMEKELRALDIRRLRLQLGLSQAQFATLLGVNQSSVSKWERDEVTISRMARKALERMLRRSRRAA